MARQHSCVVLFHTLYEMIPRKSLSGVGVCRLLVDSRGLNVTDDAFLTGLEVGIAQVLDRNVVLETILGCSIGRVFEHENAIRVHPFLACLFREARQFQLNPIAVYSGCGKSYVIVEYALDDAVIVDAEVRGCRILSVLEETRDVLSCLSFLRGFHGMDDNDSDVSLFRQRFKELSFHYRKAIGFEFKFHISPLGNHVE